MSYLRSLVKAGSLVKATLIALGLVASQATMAAPAATTKDQAAAAATPRLAIAVVVSWNTQLGASNGRKSWQKEGFGFKRSFEQAKQGIPRQNAPIGAREFAGMAVPQTGSQQYFDLVRKAADSELTQIKAAGFDAFAFDMLPQPAYKDDAPLSVQNESFVFLTEFKIWLEEAQKIGLKGALFADIFNYSGDYPNKYVLNRDEWVKGLTYAIPKVIGAPAYLKIDGKPVVMHFGTDRRMGASVSKNPLDITGGWRDIIQSVQEKTGPLYFIADVRQPIKDRDEWLNWASGVYIFAPSMPMKYQLDYQEEAGAALGDRYFWVVSPGYYKPKVAFTEPSYERIHDTYAAMVKAKARGLVFLTWNDFGEETDAVPTLRKGDGLSRMLTCYNAWFKNGGTMKCDEFLVVSSPLFNPKVVKTSSPQKWGGKQLWSARPYQPVHYVWAFSNDSKTVLQCGKDMTFKLKPGPNTFEIPASSGTVECQLGKTNFSLPITSAIDEEQKSSDGVGLVYTAKTVNF